MKPERPDDVRFHIFLYGLMQFIIKQTDFNKPQILAYLIQF